ncbi:hemogen [Fukomys damarensis]|uniref:Hemogen n=1 Tax=Fukomys damarensis TaxID=885580 RepID=A0A091CMF4_FUKDA|nr:hemogen [Fukomys damarensis]XP_010612705.1 hemogen [Fukomys damarensis]XP_010612706.1 hemogen [Fukomys damarensis]KFO19087.1 Hemogen [Fukomys damarensis]
MDLREDQSHLQCHQTPERHQRETPAPEIIGTWSLRNREQLRKRKAEAQEKQTSQWAFGEQKKRKWQKTGKVNQRGRKRQRNAEPKIEPQSQTAKEMMEKALVPTEAQKEPHGRVSEAPALVASPQNIVAEEHSFELPQESITHQENSSEYQEIVVQSHSSETCQHMAETEDLAPKMCQDILVLQDHSSKVCQGVAQPEVLAPKTSQEIAVIQEHPFKIWQDTVQSEVLVPQMCQETAVPKAPYSTTYEVVADQEGCTPEASLKLDVPKDYAEETHPGTVGPKKPTLRQDQAETEGFFLQTQEISQPKDLSTKKYQETIDSEYFSHNTYKEMNVPNSPSHKRIQETPKIEEYSPEINQETLGPEDHSPEIFQETPQPGEYSPEIYRETPGPKEYSPETYQGTSEPEDLSTKTYTNGNVLKEDLPEPYQETGKPHGQDPTAHGEDAKDVYTLPQEMQEKPKIEEPEVPVISHIQEIHPENDVYDYVLF